MKPGQSIPEGYEIEEILSSGRQGRSFLARPRRPIRGGRCVLKILEGTRGIPLTECLREDILDLASLGHPSLALPERFGSSDEEEDYIVRPFVDGADIVSALRGAPPRDLAPWLAAAAEGLGVLHRAGILHRNLKPSNLMVPRASLPRRRASTPRVVLCDPAWWPDGAGLSREDGFSTRAPELAEGSRSTTASDLHALGGVLHAAITGHPPRIGRDGLPLPAAEIDPRVPQDLDRLLLKLLARDPRVRYQTVEALVEDLRSLAPRKGKAAVPAECLVGREEEIAGCARVLGSAMGPTGKPVRPAAITVSGAAGMGKTAFLRRLALEAQVRGYETVSVRCHATGQDAVSLFSEIAGSLGAPRGMAGAARGLGNGLRPADGVARARDPVEERRRLSSAFLGLIGAPRRRPLLLLVDDAHLAGRSVIEALASMAEEGGSVAARPSISLALAYRSETPYRRLVEPLLGAFSSWEGPRASVELRDLSPDEVEAWCHIALPSRTGRTASVEIDPHRTALAVREALHSGTAGGGRRKGAGDLSSVYARHSSRLSSDERTLIEALSVLGRPATPALVAAIAGRPEAGMKASMAELVTRGDLIETAGRLYLRHGSFKDWVLQSLSAAGRKRLHARIASVLEGAAARAAGGEKIAIEEVAQHWLDSGDRRRGLAPALAAARKLARSHEPRRAVPFFESAIARLPRSSDPRRWQAMEELAGALARAGEHDRGGRILEGLIRELRAVEGSGHRLARLHGLCGICLHRAGRIRTALKHLAAGRRLAKEIEEGCRSPGLGLQLFRERLLMEAEVSEIESNRGRYAAAEEICRRSLEEIARRGTVRADPEVRRAEMFLLETRAHLKLRCFDFEEARRLFEESLELSRSLGSIQERVLILNNLGILHGQQSRLRRAMECYLEGEKLAREAGNDQVLVNILSNLALVHAKMGEPELADDALRRATHHETRCDSRRSRLILLHGTGLVDSILGRHACAIETLTEAIALSRELGDAFLEAFEHVHIGECRLYRGEWKAAREALATAIERAPASASPVRAIVFARRAALAALEGDAKNALSACELWREARGCGISYLENWDRIFIGWAYRLSGDPDRARGELEEARRFFARTRVPSGEVQAGLEIACLDLDAGRGGEALRELKKLRARFQRGGGPLKNPMLSARLLAQLARACLEIDPPDDRQSASLLLEAESFLIGRRIADIEPLVKDLRKRLRAKGQDAFSSAPHVSAGGSRTAPGLLGSFKSRLEVLRSELESELGAEKARRLARPLEAFADELRELERRSEGADSRTAEPLRAGAIVGRSAAMRTLVAVIRQVASTSLPVLVTGETGAGKDLVARVIHGESPRATGPFVSLDCAALPGELLEAELFGHVRGAFTGAESDRVGLLVAGHGGTVLLDGLDEVPVSLQAKLLRVLDGRAVRPLGASEELEVDLRYVFTSSRPLAALLEEGRLRRDLFFRINGVGVDVPPLRERLEDLPLLIEHFRSMTGSTAAQVFEREALRAFAEHPWPGNVRELRNVVTRLALTGAERIGAADVRQVLQEAPADGLFSPALLASRPLGELLSILEKEYMVRLRTESGGNIRRMAGALGLTVFALYKRFKKLGIPLRGG
jgi:DNA-binding NtrC family response regulator/tetratricopeptide (TPR) repeat protein